RAIIAGAGPGRGAEDLQDRAASVRPAADPSPMVLSDPSPTGLRLDSSTASTNSCSGHGARTLTDQRARPRIPDGFIGDRSRPYNAASGWKQLSRSPHLSM